MPPIPTYRSHIEIIKISLKSKLNLFSNESNTLRLKARGPRRTVRDPGCAVLAFNCLRKVHITLRLLVGRLVGKIMSIYNLLTETKA